jgi:hypothetical protein
MSANARRELPRRFHLLRLEDVSGISGTGVVAEGCQFTNGTTVLTWLNHLSSTTIYHSIDVLERIHWHEGKTLVVWDDDPHEFSNDEIDQRAASSAKQRLVGSTIDLESDRGSG